MMVLSLVYFVAILSLVFAEDQVSEENSHSQLVKTPDGPVRGTTGKTAATGKKYYAYYSIPYAKPPVGSGRFLASQPIDPWVKEHDGRVENPNICYQLYLTRPNENEDCLHLNVFTPQDPSSSINKSLPVMVNFHAGAFVVGSGHETPDPMTGAYSPKYLLEKDIIFVSFNHRLGVFGFLSTGDSVIPGNAGLSDQINALKWVQKNIAAFGGNPDKVTIVGQSSGGASVGYMILSPAAKGLFSAAILESGTPLCPWAYQRNQTEISFKTGAFVDSQFNTSRDSQQLLKVLQSADAKTIDKAATDFATSDPGAAESAQRIQVQQGFYYSPVIDKHIIPDYQYRTLATAKINKVPILIGVCAEEGLTNVKQSLTNITKTLLAFDENPARMNPQNMHITNESTWNTVGSLIKQEYSPSETFVKNELGGIKYFSDHEFIRSSVKHAEVQSQFTDVYFYQFSYTGKMGGNTDAKFPGSGNVTHNEERGYIFSGQSLGQYSDNDQLVHNRLIKIWTNFATFHNPTPSEEELLQNIVWPKVKNGSFKYVNIGNYEKTDLVIVNGKPNSERLQFWDNLYHKYGKRPFDTY